MSQLRPAAILLLLLSVITGLIYPLVTTALAQWWFPAQANGSLLKIDGKPRASALIGQNFSRADYFQGRPSATSDAPYKPLASSGSNLGGTNPALDQAVSARVAALRQANPQAARVVPVDLVTASGSGLDPQISPEAALWQAPRVADARKLPIADVERLIDENTVTPVPDFIGEQTVNVVKLNMALDALRKTNAMP
ncbi:potassium-transporting ATPase subunit KdpC [Erwinia tracheiphila]|uniref:Potassium-transporting ATPase KdpC subunit n=1 Tax=Erwinia tracheiphila TaxID=65700 RepID=A0A0M2KCW4_9GAMM|nr:potassium-transporting ATPase subunit KdpC [Erwinia tracheiphila]AXF77585.1 potassium-transporting ATPase subunit KdpC [Erwinia tracheiphila]EOS94506.1 potassium-transporting ATPase subunit C [Erwinia tracheiphila PSU-1]KKF36794.1 potassium-transporting ATPase subunit C [Erwinia tracheiphila]UIA83732.1 potassium-transporting ATPase subunit KdpC [Erwinia tracheiphila]UIA88135.1 potassium-transporting ATPase subunit KdpC [Erwinia tracheiphila]